MRRCFAATSLTNADKVNGQWPVNNRTHISNNDVRTGRVTEWNGRVVVAANSKNDMEPGVIVFGESTSSAASRFFNVFWTAAMACHFLVNDNLNPEL